LLITALMALAYGASIAVVNAYFGLKARSPVEVQRYLAPAFVGGLIASLVVTVLFGLIRT
jgi:hypothetical protein